MKDLTRREAIAKGGRLVMGAAVGASFQPFVSGCSNQEENRKAVNKAVKETGDANIENIRLTVVYDNFSFKEGLGTDWGFSCLVEGLDKTILFDAGRYHDIFMKNMSGLGIDPGQIDELVVSHDHPDHIGGVLKVVEARSGLDVAVVKSFRSGFKNAVRKRGGNVVEVDHPRRLTDNSISMGEMKCFIRNEHSLLIRTNRGPIILTGCAHPGVAEIVERAARLTKREPLLAAGGFHLLAERESNIRKIASRFKELGVRYVAPTHCSGGEAIKIFAEVYGDRFLASGVGRVITARDLPVDNA